MDSRQTYFAAEVWHGGEDQTGGEEAAVYVERTDANEVGILVRFVADDGDRPSIYLAPADAERLAVAMLRAAVAPWEAK
jgi:Na+-translocating ferredoxin:NAD+ oxidoreductase RnfG subunit